MRPIRLPPLVPVMSVKRSKSKVVPEVFDIPVKNGLVNETFEDDFKVGWKICQENSELNYENNELGSVVNFSVHTNVTYKPS